MLDTEKTLYEFCGDQRKPIEIWFLQFTAVMWKSRNLSSRDGQVIET